MPDTMTRRQLPLAEFHKELREQGVPNSNHNAVVCPICGTVQSMASLMAVGVTKEEVESYIGFSCIGRFTNAGSHKRGESPGRGCNWTLGGLLQFHRMEVVTEDGRTHPRFELATPEQAQQLCQQLKAAVEPEMTSAPLAETSPS